MTSFARQHHYIPQCYLRWFTGDRSKDSKLFVLDFRRNNCFETIPRNVAGRRDFNKVELEGVDPNAIETGFGQFESELALALESIERTRKFEGENRDYILNLIALLSVRSPQQRENWREFHEQIATRIMDLATSDRKIWESQVQQMKRAGIDVNENVSYEEIREFHEGKQYTIEVSQEGQIQKEMRGVDSILPYLSRRKWILLETDEETGHFITSDNPAILTWKNPEKVPPFYRDSPGHGMRGTELLFPVSKYIALSGSYDGNEGCYKATRELVALCNCTVVNYAYEQLYAASSSFPILAPGGELLDGSYLLEHIVD